MTLSTENGLVVITGASTGIGAATARIGTGHVGPLVRDLIEQADVAMYRAKNAGGNQTVIVDDAVAAQD